MRTLASTLAFVLATTTLHAQDTRHVTEPTFPPTCTTLNAQLKIIDGEPSSETAFDTHRIQDAMNSCRPGQAVGLVAANGNYAFLSQPLDIPNGVTLLIDGGVTLFASRNPADYQRPNSDQKCGVLAEVHAHPTGCRPFFTVNHGAPSKGSAIMGYGIINGRGSEKVIMDGKVMPNSWHDMTHAAYKPGTNTMVAQENNPKIFVSEQASDFTFYKITIYNSPNFNLQWEGPATGWTVWGIKVITAANVANTDGLEPVHFYHDVTISNSYVSVGDDNIALDANGTGEVGNVTVTNFHALAGDGISINGNLLGGEKNLLFDHVTMQGPPGHYAFDQEGIDLKVNTRSGNLVQNVTYQNFCIRNQLITVRLITLPNKSGVDDHIPTYKNITLRNITVLPDSNGDGKSGILELQGYDAAHVAEVNFDNLRLLGSVDFDWRKPQFVSFNIGPGPVTPTSLLNLTGPSVTYTGKVTNTTEPPFTCTAADFPSLVGELYLSDASATNLQTLSIPRGKPFTLNAMVEALTFESPAPLLPITFFEGSNAVGTATLSGNGTLASLTLTNLPPGTHTFTAQYPLDKRFLNPGPLRFGLVTITIRP